MTRPKEPLRKREGAIYYKDSPNVNEDSYTGNLWLQLFQGIDRHLRE